MHQRDNTMNQRVLLRYTAFFPVLLLVMGFLVDTPGDVLGGMGRIVTSPSIVLHDYLAIGGLGATLVNAGLCGIICCLLLGVLKIDIIGPFIAAVFTVTGFAFFGKNVLNIWPIFIGVAIFAKTQAVPLRNYALVALFGTTLAPLVSALAFGSRLGGWPGIAGGFFSGLPSDLCFLPWLPIC